MQSLGTNAAGKDSQSAPPPADRRQRVRHTVQSPAYASLIGVSGGSPLELSEIVDIHEAGMAIRSSGRLEAGHEENFALDLSEPKTRIPTSGRVIWTDTAGRVGIQFPELPEDSRQALKQWLLANAASAEVAAEPQVGTVALQEMRLDNAAPFSTRFEEFPPPAQADYTSILAALGAVKREVELLGKDLDAALHLIARSAQSFARASGAAIALTEGPDMVCRATAGPDAPGLGVRFRIGSGFSGECVRTGALLRCDDSEDDPRADRESCRALGIRAMVAVPIRGNDPVIGLLEVFSPEPHAFGRDDELILQRLAETASAAVHRAESPEVEALRPAASSVDDEFPVETAADLPLPQFSRSRNLVLIGAAVTVVFVAVWVVGTWDANRPASPVLAPTQVQPNTQAPAATPVTAINDLQGLRRLAEAGDPAAQFAVGARYATGEDVPQDYAESVRWFSKAAEQGNVIAQATLGAYYWAGRGVARDLQRAYFWSLLAEAGGDETSKYRVAVLASRLSRSQVVAAQQQANEWIKQHQPESRESPPAH